MKNSLPGQPNLFERFRTQTPAKRREERWSDYVGRVQSWSSAQLARREGYRAIPPVPTLDATYLGLLVTLAHLSYCEGLDGYAEITLGRRFVAGLLGSRGSRAEKRGSEALSALVASGALVQVEAPRGPHPGVYRVGLKVAIPARKKRALGSKERKPQQSGQRTSSARPRSTEKGKKESAPRAPSLPYGLGPTARSDGQNARGGSRGVPASVEGRFAAALATLRTGEGLPAHIPPIPRVYLKGGRLSA